MPLNLNMEKQLGSRQVKKKKKEMAFLLLPLAENLSFFLLLPKLKTVYDKICVDGLGHSNFMCKLYYFSFSHVV